MKVKVLAAVAFALASVATIQAGASASSKSIKIRGFVTEVRSPTSFDIDDYRIMRDESLTLEFEKENDESEDLPKDIRVGTEVEIKGEFNENTHDLHAKGIKVFPADTRKLKRTAILEQPPKLDKAGGVKWEGSMRLDGQTLLIDETTDVRIVPNSSQKKAMKQAEKARKKGKEADKDESEDIALTQLGDIHPEMYVAYEGRRLDDGRVRTTKLTFKDNEMTGGEAKLWKSLKPKVKAFKTDKSGEINVAGRKAKIIPDARVQKYVSDLANSLVPASQRNLKDGDKNKIPFQVHVIDNKTFNAFATANGVICVNSGVFSIAENEAQLAFILAHEIAHATQEHTLRQMEFHKKKRMALAIGAAVAQAYGAYNVRDLIQLTEAAVTNGYQRYLENQADRLGMEYMLAAGYDAREAPRAWKAVSLKTGDSHTNFFWSGHDNNTTRRSYLMAELKTNYAGQEFSTLRKDSEEFQRVRSTVQSMYAKKTKVKVKH
jgi:hypothetical protein